MPARKLRHLINLVNAHLCTVRSHAERGIVTTDLALISLLAGATVLTGTLIAGGELGAAELEDTLRSGIGTVGGTLYIRGSVVATADTSGVRTINVPLGATDGLRPLDLSLGTTSRPTISFTDADEYVPDVPYDVAWLTGNADSIFEGGESAVIALHVDAAMVTLRPNDRWTIQIVSTSGGAIEISRTMPPVFDPVMNLH
jgi:archaellin